MQEQEISEETADRRKDEGKEARLNLEDELLNYLAKSKATFKSQQKDDPELRFEEKLAISRQLLNKSHSLFLSKFGQYLNVEHLRYFENGNQKEEYEVIHHLNRLYRYFNVSVRQRDIKNRRYEALMSLVQKGEYFSESEMMKRNPLLYQHLVGQYMTEKEKEKRDKIDTKNISFVNLLMESIERDSTRQRQKDQEEKESEVLEENDSDSDSESDDNDGTGRDQVSWEASSRMDEKSTWGELDESKADGKARALPVLGRKGFATNISRKEKQLLKQEFLSHMYQSFLEGKDTDFDYSTIDDNDAYENVDIRAQDEEEKYFDSEPPAEAVMEQPMAVSLESNRVHRLSENNENESEDELDIYMKSLKDGVTRRKK